MNIEGNLILIKNEDKTDQINDCNYLNGKWTIRFKNSNKFYYYKEMSVKWLRDPKNIDTSSNIVYENNNPISGINFIQDFGTHIRLRFNSGYKKIYLSSDLLIEPTFLSKHKVNHCFEYLKELANTVNLTSDNEGSFLSKQYNRLQTLSPQSVLASYLEAKPLNSDQYNHQIIFPFGFNTSQKSATEKALSEQISVIEGPPGTGKTQTLLNIIANAILNKKTVAVVSNNNSATANVIEKLQKNGLDFIAAYLGNNENKDHFFDNQLGAYPNMSEWSLEDSDYQEIKTNLRKSETQLNQMLEYQNQLAQFKQKKSEFETEYKYYNDYYSNSLLLEKYKLNTLYKLSSKKILKILINYLYIIEKDGKINLTKKFHNLVVYGLFNFNFYKYSPESIIAYLQKNYYELVIKELSVKIEKLTKKLDRFNFENAMMLYSEDSLKLFKAFLTKSYVKGNRKIYTKDVLWKNFDEFIKEYPVILSTTHSLKNSVVNNYLFDYVLIDEASQVDLVTGALALSCAKKVVIVGDTKQLPNVIPTEVYELATKLFNSYKLDHSYNYAKQSLLSSIVSLYKDLPKTLLKEHYRCHPKIIGFCNQKFYNNELVVLTEDHNVENPLLLYETIKGNHARDTYNQRQIDVIFNEIIPNQNINFKEQSLGIITPYRAQANAIQKVIKEHKIEADTVHKFQGREKDIVILSTVSNKFRVNDFADDSNLINVAVSRAVNQLIVVASDGSDEWQGTNIGDLINYIKYNNFEIINSQIYSVFDLLYSSYSNQLIELLNKNNKVSEHTSENLMNIVVEKTLSQDEFKGLGYVLHQPLRMLIKDTKKLTEEEQKFALNILTHTDFVIFNKLDKMPVLVVEVDGHAFHENNPKQLKRDQMKDTILRKYSIPIIRMKTTGSQEETVLRNKLLNLLRFESS